MNYEEAVNFIHAAGWAKIRSGLERTSELAERAGSPERGLKFIHITGTNGKGSTSAFLTAILMAEGYKVGTFTSPDLFSLNERIMIDGEPIPDEIFAEIAGFVAQSAEGMADLPNAVGFLTVIGMEYFRRKKCDIVVLEVSVGGAFDATNIVTPLVSVITGVARDHTHLLGETLTEIAEKKAGIIKPGRPAVFGGEAKECLPVFKKFAENNGSELFVADYSKISNTDFSLARTKFDYKGWKNLEISLLGLYQPKNAAVVIETVEVLNKYGFMVSEKAVRSGFLNAKWPARFEILSKNPLIIYDGGHNEQGVDACIDSIEYLFPDKKINVMTGMPEKKDRSKIIGRIGEIAEKIFVVKAEGNKRAYDSDKYATEYLKAGYGAVDCGGVRDGLSQAIAEANKNGLPLLIIGSLHLYPEVMEALKRS